MKKALAAVIAALALAVTAVIAPTGAALAEEPGHGMCSAPSAVSMGINAHANGGSTPKYILNVSTDASGAATGTLVLGQGKTRLEVTDWCRVWMHVPGMTGNGEEDIPEGATVAHAVGFGWVGGMSVQVRTDVRSTDDGMGFRVHYRAWPPGGDDHGATTTTDEEEGWTKITGEGWLQLSQLIVHTPAAAG